MSGATPDEIHEMKACTNADSLKPGMHTGVHASEVRSGAALCTNAVRTARSIGRNVCSFALGCAHATTDHPAIKIVYRMVPPALLADAAALEELFADEEEEEEEEPEEEDDDDDELAVLRMASTRARTAEGSERIGYASIHRHGLRLCSLARFRNVGSVPSSNGRISAPGLSISRCMSLLVTAKSRAV